MMKKYVEPIMEIISIDTKDIIVTSIIINDNDENE